MNKLIIIFILFFSAGTVVIADPDKERADSLFRRIDYAIGHREKCRAGCEAFEFISSYYRDSSMLDSIYRVLLGNQFRAENSEDSLIMARVTEVMGNYNYIARDFDNAIAFLGSAAGIFHSLNELRSESQCYAMMASAYYLNNYTKAAIELLYKSLNIFTPLNDSNAISSVYFNLGIYLLYDDMPEKSTESFYKNLEFRPDNIFTYTYLAENEIKLNNYSAALNYLDKCSQLEFSKFVYQPPYYFRAKANYFKATGVVDSAVYYFRKAIDGFREAMQSHHLPGCYFLLGELYFLNNNKEAAVENFKNAVSSGIEYSKFKIVIGASQVLSKYYEDKNVLPLAFSYLKTVNMYKDSVKATEVNDLIAVQNMQLELSQQEEAFSKLKIKKELENQHLLSRQKWMTYSSVTAISFVSLVSVVLWRSSNARKKANKDLRETLADLKNTQQQLIQQEKLASLGSLTAGIAHEIKNPLNFVNNFSLLSVDLMQEFMNSTDERERNEIAADLKVNLEKICEHGMRADSIVRTMLQHSRNSNGDMQMINLNSLCEEYLHLAYHGKRAADPLFSCRLEFRPDEKLPPLRADAQDISRMILNIVSNAMDEVSEKPGGEVTVTTKKNGKHVYVKIKDNGKGIPEEIREKIFEPFFTTKPTGKGTGLGLSLSNEIVKAHGGTIKVTSEMESGTEFCIALPYM